MAQALNNIGIIGGSGMLGRAISLALLGAGARDLWLSNRSGRAAEFDARPDVTITADNQALVAASEVVILSLPPAQMQGFTVDARGKLVISVMAGISAAQIAAATGSDRVICAMSSPAAEFGLAYSPWWPSAGVTEADRARVTAIFEACGKTDVLPEEAQLAIFTALTGPVPGFVAFFAECMAGYAKGQGVPEATAERAVRQLFLSAGQMLEAGPQSAAEHVQGMVDYAGTTAAGLLAMRESRIAEDIAAGLEAAVARTRQMGEG
ncbi:pyrroline-5-carboxylate reductase family protein [Pararhodobacter oceanensis]|uniref:pyrroline-5-carboxylate reductase family protein n=1 Tax=Pararhodobacter oceanensis TaxID=2172121 RepID=UPI003A8F274C